MTLERGLELVDKLTAQGIHATVDPRTATPPCVLVTPDDGEYDLPCGYTADWKLWAIVPNPGNADAWKALDILVEEVVAVLPVRRKVFQSYSLSPDNPPFPAYRIEFSEGI